MSYSTPYRILSFDIGIKNLAYCHLETTADASTCNILDWRVINLMSTINESVTDVSYTCSCPLSHSTKKQVILCGKLAKFQSPPAIDGSGGNPIHYLCERHAKSHSTFLIPKKSMEESYLIKRKNPELLKLIQDLGISTPVPSNAKKSDLVSLLRAHYTSLMLIPIGREPEAVGSAMEIDLITLGRNMMTILNRLELFRTHPPTHVIMENQISTIAARMKTIQGELTMYFLMRFPGVKIEYISSRNKLKDFTGPTTTTPRSTTTTTTTTTNVPKSVYRKHKEDAVIYTRQLLTSTPTMRSWESVLNHKKKDDLADCFLQGIWYVKKKL